MNPQDYPHLEISVLKLSEALKDNPTKRMDAEYFKREWVENEERIQSPHTIGEFVSPKIANIKSLKLNKNFHYLQISDIDLSNGLAYPITEIDFKQIPDRATYVLQKNDVCVSLVRPNRNAVVLIGESKRLVGTSGFCVLRVTSQQLVPEFLYIFCKTEFFITKMVRANTASMYPAILDRDVLSCKIPLLPLDFQEHIAQLVKNAHACLEQSKALYKKAQGLLEQELGTPPKAPLKEHQIKSLKESFLSTGRLDAEFYQSKYEHLETCLREYVNGVVPLKDLVHEYSSGFAFKSVDYLEQQQPNALMLIRINNIKRNTLDTQNVIYLPAQAKELSPKDKLQKGDLLISMSGSIGLACVVHTEIEAMLNQRILKIRVKNFIPEVLALYLNSVMGRLQFERIGTGGVQTNLSYADMQNIFVPKIPLNIQEQIAALLQESLKHREQAKVLLTQAKAGAEHALTGGGGG
ncbi:restriction endonuclease subunit S [Helicobacter ailurogastricus]|uniref:restriction endonuclease subunit S n=1 Tax=Helicobacter ailurogastricus TaxID=1578720 RepID=UPI00244D8EDE|nr:restriction endonuclease subunit S [Helicobacter ailurogastricus]GMB91956.1 hypothetical protein NHP190009_11320 [Helicobacter ailurogastricus]